MMLRSRLVYRLYAIGVVQLFLVAVAAVGIAYAMAKTPPRWDMQSITAELTRVVLDRHALGGELEMLRRRHGLLLSLYDEDRHLLASNVEPPLHPPRLSPRLDPAPLAAPPRGNGPPPSPPLVPAFGHGPNGHVPPHMYAPISIEGREGVLVARFERPRPSLWMPSLTIAAGLVVVGAGALLTARWIAGPLQQLSRASAAIGSGELNARTGLARSDEIGDVARAFDNMADRIQALRAAEKELLANVAHELRTPLSRIRVALEIASEGDAEIVKSSLSEIAVDLAELEALIDDVLNATRFELSDVKATPTHLALHVEQLSPLRVAKDSAERFAARHPTRPFTTRFDDSLPPIEADPVLLRRVLDNLLENAQKYSPDESAPIELCVSKEQSSVVFQVKDNGMGIEEGDLPHVFEAFFRAERSRSRGTGGVGLGLTLAKRIVEAHSGSISVASVKGRGTSVTARIPWQVLSA
ncbi:MAG TPA: HAMP domain-containing sensor histidine kinase [Polyangiaceae bacterium]|nr:HAMP domain-containing sensor histidine kinase [Polyangiaceae bacterium]